MRERLLRFLWRQWEQLGVAGTGADGGDGWVIDPEALWLFSSSLARHDARLFDEILDWLVTNANSLSFPRLKSLARKLDLGDARVTASMADAVRTHNARLRWRIAEPRPGREAETLFLSERMAGLDFGARNETFLRHGYTRGKLELRGLSRPFNPAKPECSLLRLRSLFGGSARAEIVLYLLTHPSGHPSLIARETGYSQKNIQDTMVDLAASGTIQPLLMDGRRKAYLLPPDRRATFLEGDTPEWITWPPLFKALEILLDMIATLDETAVNKRVLASELRDITDAIRPHIEAAGFADCLTNPRPHTGAAYLPVFRNDVENLLARLNA